MQQPGPAINPAASDFFGLLSLLDTCLLTRYQDPFTPALAGALVQRGAFSPSKRWVVPSRVFNGDVFLTRA